jgi:hypothetical protein
MRCRFDGCRAQISHRMKFTRLLLASLVGISFTACITPVVHHGYYRSRPVVVHRGYYAPRPVVVHPRKVKVYQPPKSKYYKKAGHHGYYW